MGDKEIIATTDIFREKGFLYVTGTDDKGCLTILKIKAGRHRKDESKTV